MALTVNPPPPIDDKLRRVFWQIVHMTLFRFSPVPLHGWRSTLLRLFGANVGARCAIYPGAWIYAPWNLKIGDGVTIGGGVRVYSVDGISFGHRCVVSQGAHLCTASHDYRSSGFDLVTAPIKIGDDGWVAADAFVGPGVIVGPGAVVAARAVVTRSVLGRHVVAGNPARLVSERPSHFQNRLAGRV